MIELTTERRIVPQNAAQKPLISKPGTNLVARASIAAFTIMAKSPRVSIDTGKEIK